MLNSEFFRDFKVIAGHKGLDNQIQGIAILDAPDGYNWTKGKELVVSSGYVFKQDPDLFHKYIESGVTKRTSGLAIKVDRYIKKIPQYVIDDFDRNNIPLIHVPTEPSWMDIVNQLTIIVMNKNIKQFRIGNINPRSFSNLSYQARKINKILSQIEKEMGFPTMLYDLLDEKPYYSSPIFLELMDDLKIEYLWRPPFHNSKEILCDNLKIIRYRFVDEKYDKPYSWIIIPITVDDNIKAYFALVEATGLIDYFDQFALRIGFLLLQSLYEQMLVAKSIGDLGFEKFILEIVEGYLTTSKTLTKRATDLGLDINSDYYLLLMNQSNNQINISDYKNQLQSAFSNSLSYIGARMAMVDENSYIFLIPIDGKRSDEENLILIKENINEFKRRMEAKVDKAQFIFAISDIYCSITEIKRNYKRAAQVMKTGKLLYPDKDYLTYTDLGIFAWIHIEEDELEIMTKDIKALIDKDKDNELIKTLKIYLESNMNFSLAAKTLFIHINTVRKRIEIINDILNFDLEDPMKRLKLEILLKLI